MSWREFWNRDTSIYVSDRHRTVHYETIARQIASLVPDGGAIVLDFGCGEALSADLVAARAGRLILCDSSERVRGRLAERFRAATGIEVVAPEALEAMPAGGLDLAIVNSVLQYLTREECDALLARLRRLLAPSGRLIVADVIPPDVGPLTDALALLRLAARGGFLPAALVGLVRTLFSDYRELRGRLGLTHYREAEMIAVLERAGFAAARHEPNLGHNPARLAFRAAPRG